MDRIRSMKFRKLSNSSPTSSLCTNENELDQQLLSEKDAEDSNSNIDIDDNNDNNSDNSNFSSGQLNQDIDQDEKDILDAGFKPLREAAKLALEAVHGKKVASEVAVEREKRLKKIFSKQIPKGKSRRTLIFKRSNRKVIKNIYVSCDITSTDSLEYGNRVFQTGDIVSNKDDDGNVYYFQIDGLIKDDVHRELAASVTWLIPNPKTNWNSKMGFKLNMFMRSGINKSIYKLNALKFITNCSIEYFSIGKELDYKQTTNNSVYVRK